MYPAVGESQNRKEYGPQMRRLAPPYAMPHVSAEEQDDHATRAEEDELRIMQHFVTYMIERP